MITIIKDIYNYTDDPAVLATLLRHAREGGFGAGEFVAAVRHVESDLAARVEDQSILDKSRKFVDALTGNDVVRYSEASALSTLVLLYAAHYGGRYEVGRLVCKLVRGCIQWQAVEFHLSKRK